MLLARRPKLCCSPCDQRRFHEQGFINPVDPDADGFRYFFELDLFEINGVSNHPYRYEN